MCEERGKPRNKDDTIEATITNVFTEGPKGPYFVAVSEGIKGSITSSWIPKIWREHRPPRKGDIVILGEITKVSGGLRAEKARLWRMSDQS